MTLDPAAESHGGEGQGLSPMQIANHPLFTAREKLGLLTELRTGLAAMAGNAAALSFTAGEVDAAIAAVRQRAASGLEAGMLPAGDE